MVIFHNEEGGQKIQRVARLLKIVKSISSHVFAYVKFKNNDISVLVSVLQVLKAMFDHLPSPLPEFDVRQPGPHLVTGISTKLRDRRLRSLQQSPNDHKALILTQICA